MMSCQKNVKLKFSVLFFSLLLLAVLLARPTQHNPAPAAARAPAHDGVEKMPFFCAQYDEVCVCAVRGCVHAEGERERGRVCV